MNWFFCLLLAVLMLVGAPGCATLQPDFEPPRITLVGLQPESVTLLEQKYLIQLRIQNPNEQALDIRGLHYDLELNGQSFLSGVSSESVVVPPFSDAVIRTQGVSTLLGYLRQIEELNKGARRALDYRLTGRVSVGDWPGGVRFDYQGELFSFGEGGPRSAPRAPGSDTLRPVPPGRSIRM
jgi:LEA14-like dessication related protein